ncbi:MAG: IS200/IS605 family transposase [Paramuribaculum sp.]|nr:IS200/IS605 family transposase [Paramuribaculum sp.]MDE5722999.1 IS200/IS605 family transposase [Paramuribaculum sp.]
MSRVSSLHHIVFNTYQRERTITLSERRTLYAFFHAVITANNCKTLRIGGTDNHVHILVDLHPTKALSWLVGELKRSSSVWMKQNGTFRRFNGWAHEYFANSISATDKDSVIHYIQNQDQHHQKISFEDEINEICRRHGFDWKPEYFK